MAITLSSVTQPVAKVGRSALALLPHWPWYVWGGGAGALLLVLFAAKPAAALPPAPGPAGAGKGPMPTIKKGSAGAAVKEWQGVLGLEQSGNFDDATDAATKKYQSDHGLTPDGVVGPMTWSTAGYATQPSSGNGGGQQPAPKPQPAPEPTTPGPTTTGNPFGLSEGITTREGQMLAHISDGNVEHQWWPLDFVTEDGHNVHLLVSRRAFALNNGSDRLIISMTYKGAQKVADMIGGALLTTRISDEIKKQAQKVVMNSAGVPPSQNWVTDGTMGKTTRMYEQNNFLQGKVGGADGLVANEGKDWVVTRRFWMPPAGLGPGNKSPHNSANFGWYYDPPSGTSKSPGGASVVQSIGMVHDMNHADYSQLLRFLKPDSLTIDGQPWDWATALADPTVSKYIQDEGGTMPGARHPDL